jgi:hypothetical protein
LAGLEGLNSDKSKVTHRDSASRSPQKNSSLILPTKSKGYEVNSNQSTSRQLKLTSTREIQ